MTNTTKTVRLLTEALHDIPGLDKTYVTDDTEHQYIGIALTNDEALTILDILWKHTTEHE